VGSNLKPPSAPQPQQQSTNPFDPNLSDDDGQSNLIDRNERKLSIPLSLFIPRSARRESTRTLDEGNDDQVNYIEEKIFQLKFFFFSSLFQLETIR
jgi:hypothetical protein